MPDEGFGSELWKNIKGVQFGKHGGIGAPVRANRKDGVAVGLGAVARSESPAADHTPATNPKPRRWWSRLLRR